MSQRCLRLGLKALIAIFCMLGCAEEEPCPDCAVVGSPAVVEAWISNGGLTVSWTAVQSAAGYAVSLNDVEVTTIAAPQTVAFLPLPLPGRAKIAVSGVSRTGIRGPAAGIEYEVPSESEISWPDSASVTVVNVAGTTVDVRWDYATGDVDKYIIYRDLVAVGIVEAAVNTFAIGDTPPDKDSMVRIVAVGADGVEAPGGPHILVRGLDTQIPVWVEGSAWIADASSGIVTIAWSQATDNVAVERYVIIDVEAPELPLYTTVSAATYATLLGLPAGAIMALRVEAEDAAGNRSLGGPSLVVQVPDLLAPQFPADAVMEVESLDSDGAKIVWTEAFDDVGIHHYRVYQDQVLIAEPTENTITISELNPGVPHTFHVEAVDAAGNSSQNGPILDATLEDSQVPSWPVGSTLIVAAIGPTSVSLVWPAAEDNLGIGVYEVWVDGAFELSTAVTSAVVDELDADRTYQIEIRPVDSVGNSGPGLSALVTTAEMEPPSWTEDSEVIAYELSETSVTLEWTAFPEALLYRVRCGSVVLAEVTAPTTTAVITDLEPSELYAVWIQVVDVNGLASFDGPVVQFTTLDQTAPYWPPNAMITVAQTTANSVKLYWPKALDNVELDEYVVSVDGLVTLVTDVTSATLEGLAQGQLIEVSIQARDEAGNISVDGPSKTFTLELSVPETETVFQGLSVTCGGCHSEDTNTGFFVSLNAFKALLMVPPYVVPGAPDQSELLSLLSGSGSGNYSQMPPTGLTYLAQDQSGAVPISMDTLSTWIAELP